MTAPFDSLQDTGQLVQWREPCHPGHVGVTHCFVACGTTPFTSSVTTTLTKTKRLCKKHFKDLSINNRMIKQWWCDIPFLLSGCRVSWFTPSYYTLFSDGSIYRASQNRPWNFGTYGQKTTVAHTFCCDPLNIWNDSYVSTLVTKRPDVIKLFQLRSSNCSFQTHYSSDWLKTPDLLKTNAGTTTIGAY